MSDSDSYDSILDQNKPISSANVLILIDQYEKEYVDEYGNSYGKEIFKNFLIEKIEENIEEIGFKFDDYDFTKEDIINSFSEYYDKITENNDNKFDTSMQRRKDESDKLLFCKIVVCIIHKKIFINHYGLNDVVDFNDIIHYINNNHGNSPTKDGSDISKYKDRLIKRARKIDKDILENKIPINKPLKKSIKFPLSDSPDSPVNTTQDTLFNFAPISGLAAAAPIYGIGEDTFPFKHELLNENMEEDEEDEENDYELSNRGMEMLDRDFTGSPEEHHFLNEINSNNQKDIMVLDDDDDDNIFDFDEDEELPEVNRGGKKTRKKRKNKTKKRKNKRNRKSKKK